jgi:hypothetical protein
VLRNEPTYDRDFYAWTQEQARRLREGRLSELDLNNLAEEIESMGKQQRREMRNRLALLLLHLLKWQYQPSHRTPSWRHSIREQRDQIVQLLQDSPSLKPVLGDLFAEAYGKGRRDSADETGLPLKSFPAKPPFTLDQALDPLFPEDLGGPEREMAND